MAQHIAPDEWDPHVHHTMQAFVDDEEWSSGSTTTIHFPVEEIVAHISQRETLRVGDIIGTGTVGGGCGLELGKYPPRGSRVELRIEGLGSLANTWGDAPGER
jgi:2-keto-4-pentenoate hydratase/2-oxohepta-3-ene-1,7-dioic acid hydratase in catechol pathway